MADFDADAVREQIIAESRDVTHVDGLVRASMTATVRAVTDAIRELHQPVDRGRVMTCCSCEDEAEAGEVCIEYPCSTVRLCDEIDKAAGVQRDE